jgi:hypothetical protein
MSNTNTTTIYKHRNCIIETTPTESFPEMVTITKTPKLREQFLNKRYISLEKAFLQIEAMESERMIRSKDKYIKAQLEDVIVIEDE